MYSFHNEMYQNFKYTRNICKFCQLWLRKAGKQFIRVMIMCSHVGKCGSLGLSYALLTHVSTKDLISICPPNLITFTLPVLCTPDVAFAVMLDLI